MDNAYKYTDENIVSLVLKGNTDAYEELVKRYENKLLRYVRYILPESHDVEDIVQTSFIKAYENLNSFKPSFKFSSWIYRIAHNEAVNTIKRTGKTLHFPDLDIFSVALPNTPENEHEKNEIKTSVTKCLKELPVNYRDVLALYYLEDKSYSDISAILRIPEGTVAIRIRRAKAKLKEICIKYKVRHN